MELKKLSLLNFKNYDDKELEFASKINCFVGNNGVGKTNLLDAIYYLAFCKSFLNASDNANIREGNDFFVIQGTFQRMGEQEQIYCGLKQGRKKQFKRNKKDYKKLADHIGFIPLVLKTPFDTNFIFLGSEDRRRFMDQVISQFDHIYLDDLIQYNKIIQQRNRLLKNVKAEAYRDTFDVYDMQLDDLGAKINLRRKTFISGLLPLLNKYYKTISGNQESIDISYTSDLNSTGLGELLSASWKKDLILQYTGKGVHRDDLDLIMDGKSLKRFASQGQQKSFLLALKFAQYDFIREKTGIRPLLLLDDLFDKLDKNRVSHIIQLLTENHFGQIFITDTNQERMELILKNHEVDYRIFKLD